MTENSKYEAEKIQVLRGLEAIRKRPGMYVGGTNLSALTIYFAEVIELCLIFNPSFIKVNLNEDRYFILTDAKIPMLKKGDLLAPFEDFDFAHEHALGGVIVTALSEILLIKVSHQSKKYVTEYQRGKKTKSHQNHDITEPDLIELELKPDPEIFSAIGIERSILNNRFAKYCFFYPEIQFELSIDDQIHETFYSENGIIDLFNDFSKPFHLAHDLICIQDSTRGLRVELVFAYHHGEENWIINYVNLSRAPDGGSHQMGLIDGFAHLSNVLFSNSNQKSIVAILSIHADEPQFASSIKLIVSNPEYYDFVKKVVIDKTIEQINQSPRLRTQLESM